MAENTPPVKLTDNESEKADTPELGKPWWWDVANKHGPWAVIFFTLFFFIGLPTFNHVTETNKLETETRLQQSADESKARIEALTSWSKASKIIADAQAQLAITATQIQASEAMVSSAASRIEQVENAQTVILQQSHELLSAAQKAHEQQEAEHKKIIERLPGPGG